MVRKRGPLDRIESIMRKKRNLNATPDTSHSKGEQNEKNLLNDRILNLYKNDIPTNDKNQGESSNNQISNQPQKIQNVETSKLISKTNRSSERKKISALALKHSTLSFDDVGGLDTILMEVFKLFMHFKMPQLFTKLGVPPVRGFLLHGPPGCGKTHLAQAIAGELSLPYIEVAATELVCGISGESESKIRDLFDDAVRSAPCILFIDEIDAISPKRESTDRGMERRMVTQLLKCLDELNEKDISSSVMVIGATNRLDSIDPALRRGGRFDREIAIGIPDENARLKILKILCKKFKLAPDFDMQWLAHHTPGYVGSDLKSLVTHAVGVGIYRMHDKIIESSFTNTQIDNCNSGLTLESVRTWYKSDIKLSEELFDDLYFEQKDFKEALRICSPCAKREGFATVANATWDDVGSLEDIKKHLQAAILWPVKYREIYEDNHFSTSKGILLYGPKGCGKTLLAKAIANECSINFIAVKGPELLSMYLGESERAVRQCFQRARNSAPCVIFFDELDALCPTRTGSNVNAPAERVVNQLLTEMDGMEERKQVFVIGATNRLEKIDSAMLRPGRLGKVLYVGLPSSEGRVEILKRLTKNKTEPKISEDVDLEAIASRSKNFSGADLSYLVDEASSKAMDEHINSVEFPDVEMDEHTDSTRFSRKTIIEIKMAHFEYAFSIVKPSISEQERIHFESRVCK